MIENYQQAQELTATHPTDAKLATVTEVGSDYTVKLRFDGELEAGQKSYKRARDMTVRAGSRVVVQKVGGTYIAICTLTY